MNRSTPSDPPAAAGDLGDLARYTRLDGLQPPEVLHRFSRDTSTEPELIWRNELGGLTFRLRTFTGDRHLKFSPRPAAPSLQREAATLTWLDSVGHPVPRLLDAGCDDQGEWMLTESIAATDAVREPWRSSPQVAIAAIASGLRALHELDPASAPPWLHHGSWARRQPAGWPPAPELTDPVVVHGDACAPNTLIGPDGRWAGHVDLGDLTIGDRWADLAIAAMSLGWNYGPGHQPAFYRSYGIDPDEPRIAYFRRLWDAES